jgi:type IV pilus assembly protein PilM
MQNQPLPIGLDIGTDSVKMLQVEAVSDHVAVVASGRMAIPEEARADSAMRMTVAADLVRQMLQTHPFEGTRIVACLPREIVHIKNVRLPLIPAAELSAAVEFEARNIFPFDVEQARMRYVLAGEVRQGTEVRQEVIAFASQNEQVSDFVEQLNRSGGIIESLDIEPCALHRCYERYIRRRDDEQEVYVLVDIGLRSTQVIVCRGRDLSFYKSIEVGGADFNASVSRKLGISVQEARALRRRMCESASPQDRRDSVTRSVFDATRVQMEELARELAMCLRYYLVTFRGHRPRVVRLVGGEANDPQLLSMMRAAASIPVEVATPLLSADTSRMRPADRHGNMSEWATAMGLALRTTRRNFGPIDGKPRDAIAAKDGSATPLVEVVDLNHAVQAAAKLPDLPARRSSDRSTELAAAGGEASRA